MIRFTLAKVTNNSRAIARRIANRKHQWLDQFGVDVRDRSREIQKESVGSSTAGSPPSVHSPPPNLETIEHAIDKSADSVLVGPVFVPGGSVSPALPGLIERGGRGVMRAKRRARAINGRVSSATKTRYFKARPYILPAAKYAIKKLHANARKGF